VGSADVSRGGRGCASATTDNIVIGPQRTGAGEQPPQIGAVTAERRRGLSAVIPTQVTTPGQSAGRVTLRHMLITTMNDVPGHQITQVYGEVFGLTVRSRNVGSQIGAAFKSLAGGELKGMTKNLESSRQEAIDRLTAAAAAHGANAIVAMRFDTTEMGDTWTEVCAYGTACTITPA
jgi:uncharacterized protein YbjQ (UPF0145 family)